MRKYHFEFVVNGSEMMKTISDLIEREVDKMVITQLPTPEATNEPVPMVLETIKLIEKPKVDWDAQLSSHYATRGVGRLVMELARKVETFDSIEASQYVHERGFVASSASATLTRLSRMGLVERINPGHRPFKYRLTPPKGFINSLDVSDEQHH